MSTEPNLAARFPNASPAFLKLNNGLSIPRASTPAPVAKSQPEPKEQAKRAQKKRLWLGNYVTPSLNTMLRRSHWQLTAMKKVARHALRFALHATAQNSSIPITSAEESNPSSMPSVTKG